MRRISLIAVVVGLVAGCGSNSDQPEACSAGIFKRWALTHCPSSIYGCLSPLDLSDMGFGRNALAITFDSGAQCNFTFTINMDGSDLKSGSGSFTDGRMASGTATDQERATCASFNDSAFTWKTDCETLSITNATGTAKYQ